MALYRTQLVQAHELINSFDEPLMNLQFPMHIDTYRKPILVKEIVETDVHSFALKRAAIANSHLANYLEPLEHGGAIDTVSRQLMVLDAASNLHIGAIALAQEFKVDIRQSLRERMQ